MSCTVGPGWFGDVFDVAVQWDTEMFRAALKPLEDDDDEDRMADEDAGAEEEEGMGRTVATVPVFTGSGPIKGIVTIAPIARAGVWHGGITVSLECVLTRFRVMEASPIVRVSKRVAEESTITEETSIPFEIDFSPDSVPETFDGSSFSVRCMASVVVVRPWWTFDVTRSFQFATQSVQPALGDEWTATEDKFREELKTLVEAREEKAEALAAARAAGKEPDEDAQALIGPIMGLSIAEADEVPWWLVVSDGGCRAIFDFGSSVVDCEQLLGGSLIFQDVTAPIVRVRIRLLRIEALGSGAQDTVLFDGDAMDALTERGRRACEAIEAYKMRSLRGTGDDMDDAGLDSAMGNLSDGLTVEEARRKMRSDAAKQAEQQAAATSPRSAAGTFGGLGAAAAASAASGETAEAEAASKGADAGAAAAARSAEAAAALLPGAGILWDPSAAVVVDSTLEASLDLSMLDVLPSAFGEAEDPDAEPEEPEAASDGAEPAGSGVAGGAGGAMKKAGGIDFSIRTILQVWVYTVNPVLPGSGAKRGGAAADAEGSDAEEEDDDEEKPWLPIVPAWSSREILTFRSRPLALRGEDDEGAGEAELLSPVRGEAAEAGGESSAVLGAGEDGAAVYRPYGGASVVPVEAGGKAEADAAAVGVDLSGLPDESIPRAASVGSVSSTHSRRGVTVDTAAASDGDSVHVGITPTVAGESAGSSPAQRGRDRPSLHAPEAGDGRTVSVATADSVSGGVDV